MTLRLGILKSKDVVFPAEVAEWANMPTSQLKGRAANYCMVVNSAIHSLVYQSEIRLKRARESEENARKLYRELDLARGDVLRAKKGTRIQEEVILILTKEKKKLKGKKESLLWENENLKAMIKEHIEIFDTAISVEEFMESPEFHELQVKYGSNSYRSGFKLCKWLMWRKFPELDFGFVSMSTVTLEMAKEANEEPNSSKGESDDEILKARPLGEAGREDVEEDHMETNLPAGGDSVRSDA